MLVGQFPELAPRKSPTFSFCKSNAFTAQETSPISVALHPSLLFACGCLLLCLIDKTAAILHNVGLLRPFASATGFTGQLFNCIRIVIDVGAHINMGI